MFATQKADTVDVSGRVLVGIYYDRVEPIDGAGYGSGPDAAWEMLRDRLFRKHPNSIVLNTKMEITAGSAHYAYNRKIYTVTGDLYK